MEYNEEEEERLIALKKKSTSEIEATGSNARSSTKL